MVDLKVTSTILSLKLTITSGSAYCLSRVMPEKHSSSPEIIDEGSASAEIGKIEFDYIERLYRMKR